MARSASETNRLEQLEGVLPVAVFAKWYKCDQKKHPKCRRTDIDDQVWYVSLRFSCRRALMHAQRYLSRLYLSGGLYSSTKLPAYLSCTVLRSVV
jgi:hypothetical protein